MDESEKNMSEKILKVHEKNKFDAIVTLGRGETVKNTLRLQKAGINVVYLPETIDNNIWGTDNSIGFVTALGIATEVVD